MWWVLAVAVLGVNPTKYRSCAQSPFCMRTRFAKGVNWTVNLESTLVNNRVFKCEIGDRENVLFIEVMFLKAGTPRIRVYPKDEKFVRYDVAREGDLMDQQELADVERLVFTKNETHILLKSVVGVITVSICGVRIDYLDQHERLIATLNGEGTAVVEAGEPCRPSMFQYHVDRFKNGATAVAMDVTFFGENIHFFGLPAHTLPFDLPQTDREPIRLWNSDINSFEVNSPMAMYGSVPFLFAHAKDRNAGVLWLNPSETWIDLRYQSANEKTARFMSEAGLIDIFLFCSHKPAEIMDMLTRLSGRPMMVPMFALGLHQSRWGYVTQEQVLSVSSQLDEIQIPHETIWLDLDYTEERKYMIWNRDFPDPREMLAKMQTSKRGIVVIVDPHLKASTSYRLYKEARNKKLLLKNADGDEYNAKCWPGISAWPDFINPDARKWWASQFAYNKFEHSAPNLWIWNDMNEIAVFESVGMSAPKDVIHYNGHEEREVHNVYGSLMVTGTYKGLVQRDKKRDKRPFILSRAFFLGTQKYALVWSGDNTADWDHLRNSIQLVLSFGLGGQVFSGSDVGGFFDSPSPELLSRWYQVGAWCYPFFRVHCHHLSEYREVYKLSGVYQTVAKDAVYDRYRLMPYWYTLARQANMTGEPLIRPIWWYFDEPEFVSTDDKVFVGPALLVCPFLNQGNAHIDITLPQPARWFLYDTFAEVHHHHKAEFNDGRTVVFAKGGSIIPIRKRIRKSVGFMEFDPITLRVFLDSEGQATGELYLDDGCTFAFLKGQYIHRQFTYYNCALKSTGVGDLVPDLYIEAIEIAGIMHDVHTVTHKGKPLEFEMRNDVLYIQRLKLAIDDNWKLKIR